MRITSSRTLQAEVPKFQMDEHCAPSAIGRKGLLGKSYTGAAFSARNPTSQRSASELKRVEHEIASTGMEIDELVYELYGITDQKRKIIEETT